MSLKQEIETWVQALTHYDQNEFEAALSVFSNIADTSKILFNCGVIHATIGEHDRAVDCYQRAIALDQYLAVAYFQEGVSNFLVGDFEEALANFNDTLLYLRGNTYIDYEQLGLKFKLYSCEVLFNRGLCYIYLQQEKPGMQDFTYAVKEKMTTDHDVIDEAIREKANGYTVFSIPVGVVYRPNEAKVKNLKTKDYLGKARLVATANAGNLSTGFTGADQKEAQMALYAAKDDRPPENISFAATNLVQRNLSSKYRDREQSAPPSMGRPTFPPTPPPDSDKPSLSRSSSQNLPLRTSSVRSSNPRNIPPPLQLDRSNNPTPVAVAGPPPAIQPLPLDLNMAQPSYLTQATYNPQPTFRQSPQGLEQGQWAQQGYDQPQRPRMGSLRSVSESRGINPSRQNTDRSHGVRSPPRTLYGERTSSMDQPNGFSMVPEEGEQFGEVYDMYASPRRKDGMKSSRSKRKEEPIAEEEGEVVVELSSESQDDLVFKPSHSRHNSRNLSSARRSSRTKTDMKKIRVKVHFTDDIRYILIPTPTIDFDDFESRVREKFSIKGRMRLKIKDMDDEDMVTMGDQDDLEMLVTGVKAQARKERSEMGKMEVWVQEL